jgi:hypothetical protein
MDCVDTLFHMKQEIPSKNSTNTTLKMVITGVVAAVLVGGAIYAWQVQIQRGLETNLNAATNQARDLEEQSEVLNAQLSNLNAEVAELKKPKLTFEEQVRQNSITCSETLLVPSSIQYSYDDPRDYLGVFFNALNKNNVTVASAFLQSVGSSPVRINVNRDYSDYTFTINSWSQNRITVSVTTLAGRSENAVFVTAKDSGCWKITSVIDPESLLQ